MTAFIIFFLLFALMLTGMPVSISLGLTVLTFLFAMTQAPLMMKHMPDDEAEAKPPSDSP